MEKQSKTQTSLSLDTALLEHAQAYGIDLAQAAESGIAKALKSERERQWREENKAAIEEYNKDIDANGLPFAKFRSF